MSAYKTMLINETLQANALGTSLVEYIFLFMFVWKKGYTRTMDDAS